MDPEVSAAVSGESMPQWLERPGASEAVVVGTDIRSRYGGLKADVEGRADQVILTA